MHQGHTIICFGSITQVTDNPIQLDNTFSHNTGLHQRSKSNFIKTQMQHSAIPNWKVMSAFTKNLFNILVKTSFKTHKKVILTPEDWLYREEIDHHSTVGPHFHPEAHIP